MSEAAENSNAFNADAQQIGQSYAAALLGAADKVGKAEQVVEELESFRSEVMLALPNLASILESLRVPAEVKIGMIDKAVGGKTSQEFHNFLRVVARHGRFDCLKEMTAEARRQLNEKIGRVQVAIRSAVTLDDTILSRIADRLKGVIGAEIQLVTDVDPELIGGLEVRIGDTVYDGTVVRQLARMREQAVRKTYEEIRHHAERFVSGDDNAA